MRRVRRCVALIAASGLAVGWGCGDRKPAVETSMTEATVTGTITKGDKPVTKGRVIFDPANYLRKDVSPRSAPIDADGHYAITTLIGSNMVEVHATGPKGQTMYSTHNFDVKKGENTFDLVLP